MRTTSKLQEDWEKLGDKNAFWAVLSDKKNWNEAEFFATGRKEIANVLKVLKKNKIELDYSLAVDFGSGLGRLSQALGKHFKKVVGVDIAGSMITQANKLNKLKNVKFQHITTGNLKSFKEKSVSFIFTDIVFQHMSNNHTRRYLKDMYAMLKPGGVLVFQLPSRPRLTWKGILIFALPDALLTKLRKGMEMNPIPKEDVLKHLNKVGFEVITVESDPNHKHWDAYFYYVQKPRKA